jgi:hypothetical protein
MLRSDFGFAPNQSVICEVRIEAAVMYDCVAAASLCRA